MGALTIIAANAAIRMGYGVVALVVPSRPVLGKVRLAPDTEQFPEARLFVRGFAAHQIAVAALGLASLSRRNLRRPAMLLAATIDIADIASALIDARARGRLAPDLTGGVAFSAAGLASALAALKAA